MFSGIIEEMGVVKTFDRNLTGARLSIFAETTLEDLKLGASVSVSGVCVTAADIHDRDFVVDVSTETLNVTNLGELSVGTAVNLERAMKLNERIGGHLVSGHVEGIGILRDRQPDGDSTVLTFEVPEPILRYCIKKGSLTIDGVSLTINHVTEKSVSVTIIPHTAKVTTLGLKQPGDSVNLEPDLIGKYVERLMQNAGQLAPKPAVVIDQEYLKKRGLL